MSGAATSGVAAKPRDIDWAVETRAHAQPGGSAALSGCAAAGTAGFARTGATTRTATLHNTGADPVAVDWPTDLARQRAERARVASASAAEEREATDLLRQALVHALLGWDPSPMTAAQLARYLEPRGVPHGDLVPHLAAIVELGLAFETTCLVGRDRVPGWAVVPDLRERVSERGVAVLVAGG